MCLALPFFGLLHPSCCSRRVSLHLASHACRRVLRTGCRIFLRARLHQNGDCASCLSSLHCEPCSRVSVTFRCWWQLALTVPAPPLLEAPSFSVLCALHCQSVLCRPCAESCNRLLSSPFVACVILRCTMRAVFQFSCSALALCASAGLGLATAADSAKSSSLSRAHDDAEELYPALAKTVKEVGAELEVRAALVATPRLSFSCSCLVCSGRRGMLSMAKNCPLRLQSIVATIRCIVKWLRLCWMSSRFSHHCACAGAPARNHCKD